MEGVCVSDFEEYVAARGQALLALTVLVVGSEHEAQHHVSDALARAMPRWDALVHDEDPDAHLRRDVLATATRHRRRGEVDGWRPVPQHDAMWRDWLRLPPATRAVLALRYVEERTYAELTWLTGLSEKAARRRAGRALARLGPEEQLVELLRARSAAVDPWPVELSSRAARTSRSRRERRVGWGVLVGVAAVVAVPVVLTSLPGAVGGFEPNPVPDESLRPETPLPQGWRAESWRGLELGVPDDWGYGALAGWCTTNDSPSPRVERPGPRVDAGCSPALAPGVQFRTAGSSAPEVPPGLFSEEIEIGGAVALVATPDAELTAQVVGTARAVERLDASGCEVQRAIPRAGKHFPAPEADTATLSVCRYAAGVSGPNLVRSERLSLLSSAEVSQALEEAPTVVAAQGCLAGPGDEAVLVADDAGDVAWIHLGRCQAMDDQATHLLTEDLLFWVLSPGWQGERGDLPLPDRLRQGSGF